MSTRFAAIGGKTLEGYPIVAALRVQLQAEPGARPAWRMTFRCPFCGEVHTHGLGPGVEDEGFGSGDGTWVPHCAAQPGDRPSRYYLRETRNMDLVGTLPRRILDAIVRTDRVAVDLSHGLSDVSSRRA